MTADLNTQTWEDRRRLQLERRTLPFIQSATGMVAIDVKGRYYLLGYREWPMDGEMLLQCPDERWTVDELANALDLRYETATARWAV